MVDGDAGRALCRTSFYYRDINQKIKFCYCLKKSQNASKPSEHPPDRGGGMSKRLGGNIGCKDKTSSWHIIGFPVGEKPNVILYIYYNIDRHAGTPSKTKTKDTMNLDTAHFFYIGSRIGWVSGLLLAIKQITD